MTADEQRIIGALQQAVENLARQAELNRAEVRSDMNRIFSILDQLREHGCAVGARNSRDIEMLRNAPARAVSVGAALIAILSGVLSALSWWRHN